MPLYTMKECFELPFEFAGLARSSGHALQLEHSLEDLADNLGHQLNTQGPGQNVATDIIVLGTGVIDLRGVRKRMLLDGDEKIIVDTGALTAHILTRTRDVEVDQVTSLDRGRTHGLVGPGFAVDTLNGWVNPQHLGNIALQVVGPAGGYEGLGDIGLVKEDIGHVGERWRVGNEVFSWGVLVLFDEKFSPCASSTEAPTITARVELTF